MTRQMPCDPHQILADLRTGFEPAGDLARDVAHFLTLHSCPHTAGHSARVAAEATRLAGRFGCDSVKAESAGLLHDVSAVIPNGERLQAARAFGLGILPEEEAFPMIIHQKLSAVLARAIFGISDGTILSAIGCHTTLKADASRLDKVLFVADKIAWDQPGEPPYLADLLAQLERSLEAGALCYLDHLWKRRTQLRVIHPWLVAARRQLGGTSGDRA